MSNTKKIALMSTLVLLLAVTAVCNFVLAGTQSEGVDAAVEANYFTTYRADRNTTRSEEFVQLDSVISAYEPGTEEYDAAVNSAMASIDDEEQTALYKEAETILNEEAASIWIQDLCDLVVTIPELDGVTLYRTYVLDMSTIHYK